MNPMIDPRPACPLMRNAWLPSDRFETKVTPMRELPKDIDADVVIEISRLLDDSALFVPVRVHELTARVRQKVKTGLPDRSIEELIVEMASLRRLAMAFELPGSENVVQIPQRLLR
ncbi:hypothetical protein LB524_26555 [Mesorhizobium sp. ESP6-5]|uniref:hypothetical protein n=2 Tax=unclassified Mesorhizobium TaxID=325217 RepID=UPI001CCD8948|nr:MULTISPECIES: hypothetical protein [unclassified Mesorhizobium]MBZ9682834.1 hypothetical protein [Mesorhizobium sp. CO1-1-2]MBZ9726048.1 hypothetical protein [Mesorhizobium sp. CO1-1-11]MBZ9758857.1 hypothetical protein [Mesorhizobium sp. ESP6-5]MBZ9927623.1 hypothetical protein [Mesorhizobium sp. BR1-1-4]MBZ9976637.1 hypothetical protein [Mesorhizobium sp. BR-1-1-10]